MAAKSPPLVTGWPKASAVWQYFDYDAVADHSICKLKAESGNEVCSKRIAGKNPTKPKRHLNEKHHNEHEIVLKLEKLKKVKRRKHYLRNLQLPSLKSKLLFMELSLHNINWIPKNNNVVKGF